MKLARLADRTIVSLFGLLAGFYLVIFAIDLFMAVGDWPSYERVHHTSLARYVLRSLGMIGVCALALGLIVVRFEDPRRERARKAAIYVLVAAVVVALVVGYLRWAAIGFDH